MNDSELRDRHDRAVSEFNRMLYEKNLAVAELERLRAAAELALGDWANVKARDRLRSAIADLVARKSGV